MSSTFTGHPPALDIRKAADRRGQDERDGFKFLFIGATTGLKNPRAHGTAMQDSHEDSLEYLAVASMLMRRLDLAAERQDL